MRRLFGNDSQEQGSSAVHCLNYKTRCVAAQAAESDSTCFLIGTTSLRDENEIHVIRCDNTDAEPELLNCYRHKNEMWHMAPSPSDAHLLFTCHNRVTSDSADLQASLWRMNEQYGTLDGLVHLPSLGVSSVLWKPESSDAVVAVCKTKLSLYHLAEAHSVAEESSSSSLASGTVRHVGGAAWDPFYTDQVAVAVDNNIRCFDTRSTEVAWCIERAHGEQVRDVDYSEGTMYAVASGGDDGCVKLWDYRHCNEPVAQHAGGHSHWVWNVQYNPSYGDRLLLSSGTDGNVNLWSTGEDSRLIKTYDEHEDSVYGIAWSSVSPWTFVSLSYDGRAVICEIPKELMMEVLLSGEDEAERDQDSDE